MVKTAEQIAAEKALAEKLATETKAAEAKAAEDNEAKAVAMIAKAVEKAMEPIAKAVADLQSRPVQTTDKSTNHMAGAPLEGYGTGARPVDVPKGIRAARFIKAAMLAKMRSTDVGSVLRAQGYELEEKAFTREVAQTKALGQSVFVDGGALVPAEYSTELIELLRNKTAVRSLGARVIPMGASMEIPEQTQAATASYVGEGVAVTPSSPKFGGMKLSEKKLMALVPISNDLLRNASTAAEGIVRDDLVQVMAIKEDYQALFGVGSENSPRGITSLALAANQYAATASSPTAPTLAEVKRELAKAKRHLKSGKIPMISLGWVMSPRTEEYLYSITDGNGNSVFQAALDAGTLHGAPVVVTSQIPENLGSGANEAPLFFGDWAQFVIGEAQGMEIEMFPNATYDNSGTVVSGVSTDTSVVRAKLKHDFGMRYRGAFVVVATQWGA